MFSEGRTPMWFRLVFASWLAILCANAFAPAPIRMGNAEMFVVGPLADLMAPPQNLAILYWPGSATSDLAAIPRFTQKPDQTIKWDARGWCVEASGDKIGDVVRVNYCSGGAAQKWNVVPNSHGKDMIQLQDSQLCLDVAENEHLNGSPIKLGACEDRWTEAWSFYESSIHTQGIPIRNALFSFLSMAAFGSLGLGAWLRRRQHKTYVETFPQPLDAEQGGVTLAVTAPLVSREDNVTFKSTFPMNTQELDLAAMCVAPMPVEVKADVKNDVMREATEFPSIARPASRRAFLAGACAAVTLAPATGRAAAPGEQGSPFDWTSLWQGDGAGAAGQAEQKRTGLSTKEVAAILEQDLAERKYILTGEMTTSIFAEDCRFVDPNNSVQGLRKYKQALSFLFDPSESSLEAVRVVAAPEGSDPRTITADYVAQGQLKLPWKPRISPWKGHIVYTLDERGLIVSQVDEWNISRFTALRQTFGLGGP